MQEECPDFARMRAAMAEGNALSPEDLATFEEEAHSFWELCDAQGNIWPDENMDVRCGQLAECLL
jgi:hypothetical protein